MIVRRSLLRHSRRLLWEPAYLPSARNITSEVERSQSALTDNPKAPAPLDRNELNGKSRSPLPSAPERVAAVDPLVEAYQISKHIENTTGQLGTDVGPVYQPNEVLIDPPRPADVTLELLLASQAHLGHATSLWNPANSRYIFGIRQGIHIISLEVTAAHLRRAARVVAGVAERAGLILFVGTRKGQERSVVKAAQLAGGYHLFESWTPGAITNGEKILGNCARKLVNEFDEEIPGYEEQLHDSPVLKPDLVVCLNPLENEVLLHECALANIPTIGVIDTDANPTWVTYPIPANDDSLRCTNVISGVLGRAGEEGRLRRLRAAKMGYINYTPATEYLRSHVQVAPDNGNEGSQSHDVGSNLESELEEETGARDRTGLRDESGWSGTNPPEKTPIRKSRRS